MRYWGGFIQCGEVPPIPPIPPVPPEPDEGGSGGRNGRKRRRIIREFDPPIRREKRKEFQRASETGDEEDIELILTVWLNLE